jgi:hypothetical protein
MRSPTTTDRWAVAAVSLLTLVIVGGLQWLLAGAYIP